jgi:hypothetical protein
MPFFVRPIARKLCAQVLAKLVDPNVPPPWNSWKTTSRAHLVRRRADDGGRFPDELCRRGRAVARRAETPERLLAIRQELAGYAPKAEGVAIRLATERVSAAILAHRTFLKGPGRNMLVPRPQPAVDKAGRPGQWRKLDSGRRSKA